MVKVSVALCTFNGARFVEQQLTSILSQTLKPAEIIVADDGSTDATLEIVRTTFEMHGDPAIALRVLTGDGNRGITANFQRAIEACTGELIALSDQDDVWHTDRLASAVPSFDDSTLLLQHANARLVDDAGHPLGISLLEALSVSQAERETIDSGRAFQAYVRRNLATGATVLFRRELLTQALPFPAEWVHDEWLAIIAAAVGRVQLLDRELIDYRQHAGNQIGAQKPTLRYRVGRMLEPRGNRNVVLAVRARALANRVEELSDSGAGPLLPGVRRLAEDRARFDEVRAGLPQARVARLRTVLREFRAGSYAALSSQGNLDVARDLLQPA